MNLYKKIKWVIGVFMVFSLILATNLIDKDNFSKVEESVEIIYQDRLLTKEMLLELTNIIHNKEIVCLTNDSSYYERASEISNIRINDLIDSCGLVASSKKEKKVITDLRDQCSTLFLMEQDSSLFSPNSKLNLRHQIDIISHSLDDLALVQVAEGHKQRKVSKDAIESAQLFSRIEIYLLIFLGLIIQFIILYSPKNKDAI